MSQQYRITKEQILQATNGGLEIILSYYPDAADCIGHPSKKFRMREEKTPSAAIKQASDGNWLVADFGDDGKWMNGLALVQKEEGLDFGGAIRFLAERFNVAGAEAIKSIFQPEIEVTDANPDDKEGERIIDDVYEEIPEQFLRVLFSEKVINAIEWDKRNIVDLTERHNAVLKALRDVCLRMHWFALKSHTIVKNRKRIKFSSTDYYPIFLIHEKNFQKVYQPKSENKAHRFFYVGSVEKDFLHGHAQAKQAYNDANKEATTKKAEEVADVDGGEEVKLEKLPEIIYCTGGSDALNLAALGYHVVWPMSEHYKLSPGTVKNFFAIAHNVMTCPDLDNTGQKQNHRLCMDDRDDIFLDIKTIQLPEELKLKRDFRGNPCKDVRDYFRFYTRYQFSRLVETALPYRFWDMQVSSTKDGGTKMRYGRPVYEYKPNNVRMYNFLMRNGFWRYKIDENADYMYIHIKDNRVRKVEAIDIKNYINDFMESRYMSEDLRNAFHRSAQLNETSLSALKEIQIEFIDFERKAQFFFFEDATWKVTPEAVESFKPGDVSRYVWDNEVIKHKVKKLPDMFTITRDAISGRLDIEIHDYSCLFLRYLINASRIYWRKELEELQEGKTEAEVKEYKEKHKFDIAGPLLTEEEVYEQKQHLISKIYSFGYLLHRYKDPTRSWAVFAMDTKKSTDGLSHGGSGKSICYKAVKHFLKSVSFDGRNHKLFDDNHVFESVNKHTDYMFFDDANRNFQFDRLFAIVTGVMTINPKGKSRVELAEQDIPKIAVTTNFTPNELSPTVIRRLLFTGFSDYYHHENNGEYKESRDPQTDFGKSLFNDFTPEEWNCFFNFGALACKTYMNFEKIEAPMGDLMVRNLMAFMGQAFLRWADVYFSEESRRRDAWVIRAVALDDFMRETKLTGWSTNAFTTRLEAWCRYKNLVLDPPELRNKDGRLLKTIWVHEFDNKNKVWVKMNYKKTSEMIYIQTPGTPPTDRIIDPSAGVATAEDVAAAAAGTEGKDLPF